MKVCVFPKVRLAAFLCAGLSVGSPTAMAVVLKQVVTWGADLGSRGYEVPADLDANDVVALEAGGDFSRDAVQHFHLSQM